MTLHCTDTPRATAQNERDAFNSHAEFNASAHAFIDSQHIIQTVPTNERAWHAGPTANSRFLGVELCMANNTAEFNDIWNKAVWLFAKWMVDIVGVTKVTTDNLMSHAEVSLKWRETNHVDPVAYFAKYGKTVDMFRADVQTAINNHGTANEMDESPRTNVVKVGVINGRSILNLQKVLNKLKMRDGKGNVLDEDGLIGVCTKEAVKRFQNVCALSVDGEAGPMTWYALNLILSKPLLKIGSSGISVRYLQYRVEAVHDGDFGWGTNRKVAIWQGQNGLSQDGIVGPMSWAKLIV